VKTSFEAHRLLLVENLIGATSRPSKNEKKNENEKGKK